MVVTSFAPDAPGRERFGGLGAPLQFTGAELATLVARIKRLKRKVGSSAAYQTEVDREAARGVIVTKDAIRKRFERATK